MTNEVALVLPADEKRLILRVEVDGAWAGDLLCTDASQRQALLGALSTGAVSVVTRPLPRPDWTIVDPPVLTKSG